MFEEKMEVENLKVAGGSKKRVFVIGVTFFVLLLLTITFMALFVKSNSENKDLKYKIQAVKGDWTASTTTRPTKGANTTIRPTKGDESFLNIRLPKEIKPIHYDLYLSVTGKVVEGKSNVSIIINSSVQYVVIHVLDYRNVQGDMFHSNGMKVNAKTFNYDVNQYLVFEKVDKTTFEKGNYSLRFEFLYNLRTDLKGFYSSTYTTKTGKKVDVAATQFEPVSARTAFPCLDEPAMKATFKVTIEHSSQLISLSNMPKESVSDKHNRTITVYQKTPIMSTYLLVFVVCDFESRSTLANGTQKRVNMTFYAPKDQINQIAYAMKVGRNILPFFEDFFNVSYPLPKADMIAIPDFAAGAMENWGLITYRANALLVDDNASSLKNRFRVASVVSHELAHQWFGNIVTMDWWSDLWLNEGFASYVEYLGMDSVHPDWNVMDFQVITDMSTAMALDALVNSHPIYVEVQHPKDISAIFDSISYQKGGSILRMLDNFLGRDVFVRGLFNYLDKYSYKNAKTSNLWEALSGASAGKYDVTAIMNTWIKQMGFPVVKVTRQSKGTFKLTQDRFLRDLNPDFSKSKYNSTYGYKWYIPFKYMVIENSTKNVVNESVIQWMNLTDAEIQVPSSMIVKGNAGMFGFYRVNYDAQGWRDMIDILRDKHNILSAADRAGVISDVFELAKSGKVSYETAFDIFDYIDKENDYFPWSAANKAIGFISGVLTPTRPVKKMLNTYMVSKVGALYNKYEFNNTQSFLGRYLQELIVSLACAYGHQPCVERAKQLYLEWKNNNINVPSDFRSVVYYNGVASGSYEDWDWVFERYINNTIASEKLKLMYALSATKVPWLLERYLLYAMNESLVKSQDVSYVFSYVANNGPVGRAIAWNFLKEHWDEIYKRFSGSFFSMRRIFSGVVSGFTTEYEVDQMRSFISEKNPDNGKEILDQSAEKIRANIQWLSINEEKVKRWLMKKCQALKCD